MKEVVTPKITGDMLIYEVVSTYPETMEVFFDYGIHCVGCGMATQETIAQGIAGHGIDPELVLADLNWIVEENK